MSEPYSTTGPLLGLKYQNHETGERTAELRANLYVEGDLDVNGQINQNGVPLESGGAVSLPYSIYVALLSQAGTDPPVATVLENTLGGTIVWTRTATGSYSATLAGAFTTGKTVVFITGDMGETLGSIFAYLHFIADVISVRTLSETFTLSDDRMNGTSIEIRVYP